MAISLDDVLGTMPPAQQARVKARAQKLIEEEAARRVSHQMQHPTQERAAKFARPKPRRHVK